VVRNHLWESTLAPESGPGPPVHVRFGSGDGPGPAAAVVVGIREWSGTESGCRRWRGRSVPDHPGVSSLAWKTDPGASRTPNGASPGDPGRFESPDLASRVVRNQRRLSSLA
jgi:hypothetical protein